MTEHQASRTLLKSPPELWAECSNAESLARHLDFGAIRVTTLEPERAVAWEGDDVSGTVVLEPSGWGTKVTLTAVRSLQPAAATPPTPAPQPSPPQPRAGLIRRLRSLFAPVHPPTATEPPAAAQAPEPPNAPEPPAAPPAPREPEDDTSALLAAALDMLGKAHHRPFSRA